MDDKIKEIDQLMLDLLNRCKEADFNLFASYSDKDGDIGSSVVQIYKGAKFSDAMYIITHLVTEGLMSGVLVLPQDNWEKYCEIITGMIKESLNFVCSRPDVIEKINSEKNIH